MLEEGRVQNSEEETGKEGSADARLETGSKYADMTVAEPENPLKKNSDRNLKNQPSEQQGVMAQAGVQEGSATKRRGESGRWWRTTRRGKCC